MSSDPVFGAPDPARAQQAVAFPSGRVVIWGVGLMGGSLGLALRQAGAAEVVGLGRRLEPLQTALRLGAVDRISREPAAVLDEPCLLVLGMPVATMAELAAEWGPRLPAGTVVTDLGSTKAGVVAAWSGPLAAGAAFVGGHPMCGSEKAGVEHARPDLYQGARWILTPSADTPPPALAMIRRLAELTGAHTLAMPPAEHDRRVAFISHLPQLVAVATAATAQAGEEQLGQVLALAAGGFRDTTRLALSAPEVWHEIFLTNRAPVQAALAEFRQVLDDLEAAVADGNPERITHWFQRAAQARRALP